MKTILFFIFCLFVQINTIKAQLPSPLYILFENGKQETYYYADKSIDVPVAGQNGGPSGILTDIYHFAPLTLSRPNHLETQIYGGRGLSLDAFNRDDFNIIESSQLSAYNPKTYDELVLIFLSIPLDQQRNYFWDRDVYIVEKIKTDKYKIIKVFPDPYISGIKF